MCSRESKHARRKGLFSCHRQVVIIVAYVLIIAAIVALGVKWRSWDFERIRDMDYRKHSFLKMRHIQNDNVEIQGCVNEVRERMLSEKLYIMSEYPAGNNM